MKKALKVVLLFFLHLIVYLTIALAFMIEAFFSADWESIAIEEEQTESAAETIQESESVEDEEGIRKRDEVIAIREQNGDRILVENSETGETRWITKEDYIDESIAQWSSEPELFLDTKIGEPMIIMKPTITHHRISHPYRPRFLPIVQILLLGSFVYLSYEVIKKPKLEVGPLPSDAS